MRGAGETVRDRGRISSYNRGLPCCALLSYLWVALTPTLLLSPLQVSMLQQSISVKKEVKQLPDNVLMGALEALLRINLSFASTVPSTVATTIDLASRLVKGQSTRVRAAALHCIAACVLGVGHESGQAAAVQDAALKAAERGYDSRREAVRFAAASVLAAVGRSGGAGFWNGWVGACVRMCIQRLQDPSDRTRTSFAQALGELAACPYHPTAKDLVDSQANDAKKSALAKQMAEMVKTSLIESTWKAIAQDDDRMMAAVAQAWLTFLTAIKARHEVPDTVLAEIAMSIIGAMGEAKGSRSDRKEDPRLLEFPHAQVGLHFGRHAQQHVDASPEKRMTGFAAAAGLSAVRHQAGRHRPDERAGPAVPAGQSRFAPQH